MAASFKLPKSHLVFESLDTNEKLNSYTSRHPFNCAINVLLPGQTRVPPELADISPVKDRFYVAELPTSTFIQPHFIQSTVKAGSFCALSHTQHVDTDDCVAVLPQGLLVLSVTKDTYEQLGLVGRASEFHRGSRFIIEIDLLADSFQPGRKLYDRVHWCLTDRLALTMSFLMAFIPHDSNTTSSVPVLHDIPHKELANTEIVDTLVNIHIPVISHSSPQISPDSTSSDTCSATDLFEWLGAVSCQIDCDSGQPGGFVSSYSCPTPNGILSMSCSIKWQGFITSQRIQQVITTLSKNDLSTPWCAITVWGFSDSPFSWGKQEHGFYMEGDNHYTCLIFPGHKYWLFTALGTHDKVR